MMDKNYAKSLFDKKDYVAFIEYCLSFEQIDDSEILRKVAKCFRKGDGVAKDLHKAITFYEKAVEKGSTSAMQSLAIIYTDEAEVRAVDKAIELYKKASNLGDASCMYNLGYLYVHREEGPDYEKAAEWYEKAASKGHVKAMYNLAHLCKNREDGNRDIAKAILWYERAANEGHVKAMAELGYTYKHEKEVMDIHKSVVWNEKAATSGHVIAMRNQGNTYRDRAEVRDYNKALYWYKCAARKGDLDAKFSFAKLAIEEYVTEETDCAYQFLMDCAMADMQKAVELLMQKAQDGSSVAQFYLGSYYTSKSEHENHVQKAEEWYRKSALQGYLPAQNIILIHHSAFTSETVQKIKVETGAIAETTANNSKKLDTLVGSLLVMNEKLAAIRQQAFTGNAETEESEINLALQQSAEVVNRTIQESPAERVAGQKDALKRLFGEEIWGRLLPESQKSLISSAILLKECENMPPEFDYSGICITAIVALEQELKRVFSDNYIVYLQQNMASADDMPRIFDNLNDGYYFSLGQLAPMFGYWKDRQQDEYIFRYNYNAKKMESYLRTVVKKQYANRPLDPFVKKDASDCFVRRCIAINRQYRYKAAHRGNVSYDDALDCCYEIYGESSAHVEAKKQSVEIISLLRELFSILK